MPYLYVNIIIITIIGARFDHRLLSANREFNRCFTCKGTPIGGVGNFKIISYHTYYDFKGKHFTSEYRKGRGEFILHFRDSYQYIKQLGAADLYSAAKTVGIPWFALKSRQVNHDLSYHEILQEEGLNDYCMKDLDTLGYVVAYVYNLLKAMCDKEYEYIQDYTLQGPTIASAAKNNFHSNTVVKDEYNQTLPAKQFLEAGNAGGRCTATVKYYSALPAPPF